MFSTWQEGNIRQLLIVAMVMMYIAITPEVVGLREHTFVRHYEPAYYDHVALWKTHHVTRRSADEFIHFRFKAYGRTFTARLSIDANVLHRGMVVETSHQTVPYDVIRTYNGHLEGEPSRVHGIITTSGHFEGKIYTNQETYFMERADQQFPETTDFHSVIYKLSDVSFNQSLTSCMHDRLYQRQIEMTSVINKTTFIARTVKTFQDGFRQRYSKDFFVNYGSNDESFGTTQRIPVRKARAVDPAKVTCELYMQADHLYYQRYNSDVDVVIEKLAQHVQEVNAIYSTVDFDESGAPDNISFVIKKIKIHTDPDVAGYKYSGPMDVEYFLDKHSEDDYDDFCLSYMFTHRDFSDGVLGLAWIGDISASGGLCERHVLYNNVGKSLNTGIVTTLNYGMEIPAPVSHVTFAHELGHNFGSPHDSDNDAICAPGGDDGNYIMYAHATSGSRPNNNKLSSCSIASISRVLEAKARSDSGCFVAHTDAICGNMVVEGLEECDCGWQEECTEGCCNPQVVNTTGAGTPCTIKDTSVCSPSQGPCCDTSCQFLGVATPCRPASDCLKQAFCTGSSAECPSSGHVNDTTPCGDSDNYLVCLKGECNDFVCFLANGQKLRTCLPKCCKSTCFIQKCIGSVGQAYDREPCLCNEPSRVIMTYAGVLWLHLSSFNRNCTCFMKECTGSVCLAYGREPCQCSGSSPDNWKDEVLCHVCCKDGAQCRSSYELDDVPDALSFSGSPCNDNGGYCDVFKKCRQVDPSGPLNNLKRLFLSGEALDTMKVWLTKHWYVGVAGGVALICILGLVVKFCGKSSSKRVAPSNKRMSNHGPIKTTSSQHRSSHHMSPEKWI